MINSYVCWPEYQAFVAPGVKSGLIVLGLCVCPLFDNERGENIYAVIVKMENFLENSPSVDIVCC